jgi:hypothetical protein
VTWWSNWSDSIINKAFITIYALALMGLPITALAESQASVEGLAWLTGCWANVGGEDGSGEQWTRPAGKTLFGINRTVRNSATVAYEFMQIRETGAGRIEFIAMPSGQAGATFLMMRLTDHEVVFENPEHDFPQRIIYRLEADGNLKARIEGDVEGEIKSVDFPMRPVDC